MNDDIWIPKSYGILHPYGRHCLQAKGHIIWAQDNFVERQVKNSRIVSIICVRINPVDVIVILKKLFWYWPIDSYLVI